MKQTMTPAQIRELVAFGEKIAPGIWSDRNGFLHFSVPDLLFHFGWPDDAHHRTLAIETIKRVCEEQFPGKPIVDLVIES